MPQLDYKERCPHAKNTSGYCKEVDDYIEGADLCTLVDKWCLLNSGQQCDTYEEYLQELQAEETAEIESLKAQYEAEQEAKDRYYSTELPDSPFTCVSGDIERDGSDAIEPPA